MGFLFLMATNHSSKAHALCDAEETEGSLLISEACRVNAYRQCLVIIIIEFISVADICKSDTESSSFAFIFNLDFLGQTVSYHPNYSKTSTYTSDTIFASELYGIYNGEPKIPYSSTAHIVSITY